MAPAGTLLLFLCTASALLRPALLSSGTDVSFLDRTLLEKDIAAVFNKVAYGGATTTKRSISSKYFPASGSPTTVPPPFTSISLPTVPPKIVTQPTLPYTNPSSHKSLPPVPSMHPTTIPPFMPPKTLFPPPFTTPSPREVPSYIPPIRSYFTPPLPPDYANPFADKPTLRGSNSDGGIPNAGRRPIPPPPRPPSGRDRIPWRPPDMVPNLERDGKGEQEADWLRLAGLSQLTGPYEQGRELPESELDPVLRFLPTHHAEAVRRRVKTLNLTVRQRGRQQRSRARKPDIRDVFRDVENSSTGTRSRSATPDSLDLDHPGTEDVGPPSPPLPWCIPRDTNIFSTGSGPQEWGGNSSSPTTSYIVSTSPRSHEVVLERDHLYGSYSKDQVRREPNGSASASELFRQVGHWTGGSNRGDVACDTEGIQMVGYQRLGTIHLPRPREKMRAGSDPTSPTLIASSVPSSKMAAAALISSNAAKLADRNKKLLKDHHVSISRSHSSLYNPDNDIDAINQQRAAARAVLRRSGSQGHLGFEELPQRPLFPSHENITNIQVKPGVSIYSDPSLVGRTWIEFLGEGDLPKLQPLLLLEATALLDDNGITFRKRKPPRRNRKVVGNVFGVSLATLLERDQLITAEDCQGVPLIFQKVLLHLERHGLQEEGILRVAGLQQKVTSLCSKLEAVFYSRPLEEVDRLLQQATCHDVAAVLKRLLRDLPQPLLSVEYIDMFYQTHALSDETTRAHALNLLVLLLPAEYRSTLRAVFRFLARVVQNQKHNKMSLHNVAMIIAPSLFRPQYVHPTDKGNLRAQVEMAEICCQLTEQMLEFGEKLWIVPESLVRQIRRANEEEHYRRGTKENSKPMKRLLGRRGAAREPITRKINNEVDFQDGIVRVNAPQFQLVDVPVRLSENTTAGDVVLRIMEEASKRCEMLASVGFKVSRRPYHDMKSRALAELAPNGNLSCILATSCPELSLQTHYLYEVGGNIGQRQIEHSAILLAVYKENPNAQWLLRCHHRNANNAPAAS